MAEHRTNDADRFEVISELGRGGFGTVVLARDRTLDRLVAIKQLQLARAGDDTSVARFLREARALGRLNHPNIVRLFDVLASAEGALLVMEYVPGTSLEQRCLSSPLGMAASVSVLGDLASALTHAHARGVLHRDLKPANVLVADAGSAKVTDFGLARLVGDGAAFRTQAGTVMGTAGYMAPEQILGDADIGEAVDVYAYSVIAYEMLTGLAPYATIDRRATLDAHLHSSPRSPADILPGFPSEPAVALLAGLAKAPTQRPSISEIYDTIARVPTASWPPIARATLSDDRREPPASTVATRSAGARPPERDDRTLSPIAASRSRSGSHTEVPADDVGWIEPPVYRPRSSRSSRWRRPALALAMGALIGVFLVLLVR